MALFCKDTLESKMLLYDSLLKHPRATLSNLMLTACDVVICHLLRDTTGPNRMKEKWSSQKM